MASETTRDHEEIRNWAKIHNAIPAVVSRTGAMLRFEFSPPSASGLEEVDWDSFFRVFDEKGLKLVYDDKPGSRFHKFIYPETEAARSRGKRTMSASPRKRQMQVGTGRAKSKTSGSSHATIRGKAGSKAKSAKSKTKTSIRTGTKGRKAA
ncbi:MAG TPA: hypothetical protein VN709_06545 [Terriglobales bacterium]|nr:hypothetical protein [Terriglobales bacterium]